MQASPGMHSKAPKTYKHVLETFETCCEHRCNGAPSGACSWRPRVFARIEGETFLSVGLFRLCMLQVVPADGTPVQVNWPGAHIVRDPIHASMRHQKGTIMYRFLTGFGVANSDRGEPYWGI